MGKKTNEIEQLVESKTDEVAERIENTKVAVEKVLEGKVLEKVTAWATKKAIEFVGTKNCSIEERLMYNDLDVHECVRMLVICCHEYSDKASDLEWMSQICLRELCKLEKRTREEVVVTHLKILGSKA